MNFFAQAGLEPRASPSDSQVARITSVSHQTRLFICGAGVNPRALPMLDECSTSALSPAPRLILNCGFNLHFPND
jgi:hypothetical protein